MSAVLTGTFVVIGVALLIGIVWYMSMYGPPPPQMGPR
jgi:hypothetical protein